jgi:hypothetical protein
VFVVVVVVVVEEFPVHWYVSTIATYVPSIETRCLPMTLDAPRATEMMQKKIQRRTDEEVIRNTGLIVFVCCAIFLRCCSECALQEYCIANLFCLCCMLMGCCERDAPVET